MKLLTMPYLRKKWMRGICAIAMAAFFLPFCAIKLLSQNKGQVDNFRLLATQLSTARLNGAAAGQSQQDQALLILDGIALPLIDSNPKPDLDVATSRLVAQVSPAPGVGENYHFVRLGGDPATYALVVNFGLGGPAAVRIYAPQSGHLALSGKIDAFAQTDFFDSDIELIAMSTAEPVFVTVSGRTDDLSTGVFSAWRFNGRTVALLWSSDLLQQSSYESDEKGFHLTYCSNPDDNHPDQCPPMSSDLYQWEAGEWKRIESKPVAAPASAK
jgi:hypothetical protein